MSRRCKRNINCTFHVFAIRSDEYPRTPSAMHWGRIGASLVKASGVWICRKKNISNQDVAKLQEMLVIDQKTIFVLKRLLIGCSKQFLLLCSVIGSKISLDFFEQIQSLRNGDGYCNDSSTNIILNNYWVRLSMIS